MLEDIAVVTGATVISDQLGMKMENIELKHLGGARRVTASKDKTIIIEGKGSAEAINARALKSKTRLKILIPILTKKNCKNVWQN